MAERSALFWGVLIKNANNSVCGASADRFLVKVPLFLSPSSRVFPIQHHLRYLIFQIVIFLKKDICFKKLYAKIKLALQFCKKGIEKKNYTYPLAS